MCVETEAEGERVRLKQEERRKTRARGKNAKDNVFNTTFPTRKMKRRVYRLIWLMKVPAKSYHTNTESTKVVRILQRQTRQGRERRRDAKGECN